MKNESKLHVISAALGAIVIGAVFTGNFLGVMYASDYLLPDRPMVAVLAGLETELRKYEPADEAARIREEIARLKSM